MNTYKAYLAHPAGNILTMEDALDIYDKMTDCISKITMEDKLEYWNECLKKALDYTERRCKWEFMSREEKIAADQGRTMCHNGFIDSLNLLSRIADKEGIDNSWRQKLGDERKRIGDFACFITYMTGISNR
ncbi:MAG: hypothetical protein K6G43_09275 [Lachnospiraceae bacterium]|nr:hypothetical protein [Lachnospiraceae bacterium]